MTHDEWQAGRRTLGFQIDCADVQVCMLTHNEGLLLEHTLKALKGYFSSFAIVDQSSSDNTVEIIRDLLGDRASVAIEPENYIREIGFAGARNTVSDLCSKPWILHVDADEEVTISSDDATIRSSDAPETAEFLSVARRNLGSHPDVEMPLTPDKIAMLPVESHENHVRLYRNNAGIRWRSFIHEELWQNGKRVSHECPHCNVALNHLSRFKGYAAAQHKEEFYGWMLIRGSNISDTEEATLSAYSMHVLNERKDYFLAMAAQYEKTLGAS